MDLDFRIEEFAPERFDLAATAAAFASEPPAIKRRLLELCAVVHAADGEIDFTEDEQLRRVATALACLPRATTTWSSPSSRSSSSARTSTGSATATRRKRDRRPSRTRAALVAVHLPEVDAAAFASSVAELGRLARTLGLDVVATVTQR